MLSPWAVLQQIVPGRSNQITLDEQMGQQLWGRSHKTTWRWFQNPKGRYCLGDLSWQVKINFSVTDYPKLGLDCLIVEISGSHIIRHTPSRTPLYEWSARHRDRYPHNTKQTQEKNIHSLIGIRTSDTSNRGVAGLHLRPHGQRDWIGLKWLIKVSGSVICW
jgi:hypothetical protein